MSTKPSAFIVGYTGEVGKQLASLAHSSADFSRLLLIGRRKVDDWEGKENVQQKVANFDEIETNTEVFRGADIGYCCLGTTRAKSGRDGFLKVDHDYVVGVAKAAKAAGCKQFHLVSSRGANYASWNLYMSTKGKVEREIGELGFEHFSIYRPGFLLCDRQETRFGERLASFALKPVIALRPTWISVPTVDVARAMLQNSVRAQQSAALLENEDIHRLAAAYEAR